MSLMFIKFIKCHQPLEHTHTHTCRCPLVFQQREDWCSGSPRPPPSIKSSHVFLLSVAGTSCLLLAKVRHTLDFDFLVPRPHSVHESQFLLQGGSQSLLFPSPSSRLSPECVPTHLHLPALSSLPRITLTKCLERCVKMEVRKPKMTQADGETPCSWIGRINIMKKTTLPKSVLAARSCPTLCDPMDCSLPGSSVHGVFQARILEGVAISFSKSL